MLQIFISLVFWFKQKLFQRCQSGSAFQEFVKGSHTGCFLLNCKKDDSILEIPFSLIKSHTWFYGKCKWNYACTFKHCTKKLVYLVCCGSAVCVCVKPRNDKRSFHFEREFHFLHLGHLLTDFFASSGMINCQNFLNWVIIAAFWWCLFSEGATCSFSLSCDQMYSC